MKIESEKVYEFVTKVGVNFIGTAVSSTDDTFIFKDVLIVNMRPAKTPSGEMSMVPAMDMVGIFTVDTEFILPIVDLYQLTEVKYDTFLNMYNANVSMYDEAKRSQGSNIEITNKMPDISVVDK